MPKNQGLYMFYAKRITSILCFSISILIVSAFIKKSEFELHTAISMLHPSSAQHDSSRMESSSAALLNNRRYSSYMSYTDQHHHRRRHHRASLPSDLSLSHSIGAVWHELKAAIGNKRPNQKGKLRVLNDLGPSSTMTQNLLYILNL